MSSFLFEIYSDEVPAKMQRSARLRAMETLKTILTDFHVRGQLAVFLSSRRVAFTLTNVQAQDTIEDIRGPRHDASAQALERFCSSHGMRLDQCFQRETPKGVFWFLKKCFQMPLDQRLEHICRSFLETFHWPKKMSWNEKNSRTWVRPISSLVCLLDDRVLDWTWDLGGRILKTGRRTWSHPHWRSQAPDAQVEKSFYQETPIMLSTAASYDFVLKEHGILVDYERRREHLSDLLFQAAAEKGFACFEQDFHPADLMDEVTGMVQDPVIMLCQFPEAFLTLPADLILNTLKTHQKCFALKCKETNALVSHFIVVLDGLQPNEAIKSGHEDVVIARLWDARFFWTQDQKTSFSHFNEQLKTRTFFTNLGSIYDKIVRLQILAPLLNAEGLLTTAACLSKADLVTQVVTEFPDLQGIMGYHYALTQGVDHRIAQALQEQYWPTPLRPDLSEQSVLGGLLGLIDRIDTLVGFFGIGRVPTGSSDPMALRRSAYTVIKLCLIHHIAIPLTTLLRKSLGAYRFHGLLEHASSDTLEKLRSFLLERMKNVLEEEGIPLICIQAGLSEADEDVIWALRERILNIQKLVSSTQGRDFLKAYKRVFRFLQGTSVKGLPLPPRDVFPTVVEKELWDFVQSSFKGCMETFLTQHALPLTACLNTFLDEVRIYQSGLEEERLGLVEAIVKYTRCLGDFSYLLNDKEYDI